MDSIEDNEDSDIEEASCTSDDQNILSPPFDLLRVLGCTAGIRPLVLEENGYPILLYSMCHLISYINVQTMERHSMVYHRYDINSLSLDKRSRFMVSSDAMCAIVWDLKCSSEQKPTILRVFPKPFENGFISSASISECGKFIVLLSTLNESLNVYELQFWLWSYGRQICDGKTMIPGDIEEFRSIQFSKDETQSDFFVLTASNRILFGYWNDDEHEVKIHTPAKRIGFKTNASCYVSGTREVVTVTREGRMIVWNDTQFGVRSEIISNNKEFLKIFRIKECSINDVKMIDEYITTVDDVGEIRFYDKTYRLVYNMNSWKLPSILFICPVLKRRKYVLSEQKINDAFKADDAITADDEQHIKKELIQLSSCSTDNTLEQNPFIIRNFLISTADGQISYCDIVNNTIKHLMCKNDGLISGGTHHPSENFVAFSNDKGHISVYDYTKQLIIMEHDLKQFAKNGKTSDASHFCSILKFTPSGQLLCAGASNGSIYFFEVLSGKLFNATAINFTNSEIDIIEFVPKKDLYAFTDTAYCLFLAHYGQKWDFIAKFRYHCEPIIAILVHHSKLMTVGEDRMLAMYDLDNTVLNRKFQPENDVRMEQTCRITAALLVPNCILATKAAESKLLILIATNDYKFKVYDTNTFECLSTILGPLFESPLRVMIYKEVEGTPILLVASKRTFGVALLPLTGNPFRYTELKFFKEIAYINSSDVSTTLFLYGKKDNGCSIWRLRMDNVRRYYESGGEGLIPFTTVLPGGKDGWFFQEMQNCFFHMQILEQQLDLTDEIKFKDVIKQDSIVNYMRMMGYFPSEWEIKNLMTEVKRTVSESTNQIYFKYLCKLYINYKPVDGHRIETMLKVAKYFSVQTEEIEDVEDHSLPNLKLCLDNILSVLTEGGEEIPRNEAMMYLIELLQPDREISETMYKKLSIIEMEAKFKELPQEFSIPEFFKQILGFEISFRPENNTDQSKDVEQYITESFDDVLSVNGVKIDKIVPETIFGDVIEPTRLIPELANKFDKQFSLIDKCILRDKPENLQTSCTEDKFDEIATNLDGSQKSVEST